MADLIGDAALLAADVDFELGGFRRGVAAIAFVGDDAVDVRAYLLLDIRDHDRERVSIIGIAWQCFCMGDELAASGAIERRRDGDFHAELIGLVRLALADAFDLGGVQGIYLLTALPLSLMLHALRQ